MNTKENDCDSRPPMLVVFVTWLVFFALGYFVRSVRQDEYDCAKRTCPSGTEPRMIGGRGCLGDVCICPVLAPEKP